MSEVEVTFVGLKHELYQTKYNEGYKPNTNHGCKDSLAIDKFLIMFEAI